MFSADVCQTENILAYAFGFKNQDFAVPLHYHPQIYEFVKVIRGAIAVSRYTILPDDQQEQAKRSIGQYASLSKTVAARFVAFETAEFP